MCCWLHKRWAPTLPDGCTLELLHLVGIPEAEKRLGAYPHELSGGQRRAMIARRSPTIPTC